MICGALILGALILPAAAEAQDPAGPGYMLNRVVLDPGHGGADQGVLGPGGWTEAQLTYALAEQVKTALEEELDVHVVLTREEAQGAGIEERTAAANGQKADLLISFHAAARGFGNRLGYFIYIQDYGQQAGLRNREPRTDLYPGQLGEWAMNQFTHLSRSRRLAEEIDASLSEVLRAKSVGPVGMPLALLAGADQPAVLIEVGVLTDAEAERRLRTKGYRDALTRAIVAGVHAWRDWAEQAEEMPPVEPRPETDREALP